MDIFFGYVIFFFLRHANQSYIVDSHLAGTVIFFWHALLLLREFTVFIEKTYFFLTIKFIVFIFLKLIISLNNSGKKTSWITEKYFGNISKKTG